MATPTFEVLAFGARVATPAVAVLELEGRFTDRAVRGLGRPRLLVERGPTQVECGPVPGPDAAAGPGGVPWRASFAVPLALVEGATFSLEVGRDLLVVLPSPRLGDAGDDDGARLARLAREANDLRRRLDDAAARAAAAQEHATQAVARAESRAAAAVAEVEARAGADVRAAQERAEAEVAAARRRETDTSQSAQEHAAVEVGSAREAAASDLATVREAATSELAAVREAAAAQAAAAREQADAEVAAAQADLARAREEAARRLETADQERAQALRQAEQVHALELDTLRQHHAGQLRAARAEIEALRRRIGTPSTAAARTSASFSRPTHPTEHPAPPATAPEDEDEPAAAGRPAGAASDAAGPGVADAAGPVDVGAQSAAGPADAEPAEAAVMPAAPGDDVAEARPRSAGAFPRLPAIPPTAETQVVDVGVGSETVRVLSGSRRRRHSAEDEEEPTRLSPGATRIGARSISPGTGGRTSRRGPQRTVALVALAIAIAAFLLVVVLRIGPI
jgi:hypothetical protein